MTGPLIRIDAKALQRMIAYARDEALRLRITEVATLLDRAEEAVTAVLPPTLAAPGRVRSPQGRRSFEH